MFVRKARRGSNRRPAKPAGKAKSAPKREPLSQKHLDLIGLGCIVLGIYLVFVLYFGWDGGRLGSGLRDGLKYTIGLFAYVIPVGLFATGGILIFRPNLPSTKPLRTGAAFLAGGLILAFAAGTAGIGGGRSASVTSFDPGWFPDHGGVLGESLYWGIATLFQPFGAHLVAIFALIAGILLLTGTTVAAVLSRSTKAIKHVGSSSAEATTKIFNRLPVAEDDKTNVLPGEQMEVGSEDRTAFLTDDDELTAFLTDDDDATVALADDEAEPLTTEMEIPGEAAASADSPFAVDIWAEDNQEPALSDRHEPLERIEIFPGTESDIATAEPETAEDGYGDGPGDRSGDEPSIFTEDLEEELNVLEEEFAEPEEADAEDEAEVEDVTDGVEVDDDVTADDEIDPVKAPAQMALTPLGKARGATMSEEGIYRAPPVRVLDKASKQVGPDPKDQKDLARKLVETLGHFGVEAKIVGIVTGPHVSRFELQLAPGTKVKKVSELKNDLAYALASTDIRILAPIPGKQAVGVEVPNKNRKMVKLGSIYSEPKPDASPLVAWLGEGIDGKPVSADLAKMPHVLVAGTTGSGKSGCVNAILTSILMHSSPNDVRLVLVDPKQVELNHYESVPHLLTPVVTSPKLAANVLQNLVAEMETRYGLLKDSMARNIADFNKHQIKNEEPTLPYILCVIDELADLMMVAPGDVETSIIRLAQKSRAVGIHLVLATQRPSTDIITGTIKVNIPSRIAFAVSSQIDSRVILDEGGAEALLGMGDMLFRGPGTSKMSRVQGTFVSEDEIARITKFWSDQGEPHFAQALLEAQTDTKEDTSDEEFDPDQDDLMEQAIRIAVETETASVSMIQRRLRVGYTRAGRLIDMLERRGVISGYEGSKPRQVLITAADLPRVLGGGDPATPDVPVADEVLDGPDAESAPPA